MAKIVNKALKNHLACYSFRGHDFCCEGNRKVVRKVTRRSRRILDKALCRTAEGLPQIPMRPEHVTKAPFCVDHNEKLRVCSRCKQAYPMSLLKRVDSGVVVYYLCLDHADAEAKLLPSAIMHDKGEEPDVLACKVWSFPLK